MTALRTRAAVLAARAVALASQRLGRGGGTAISGLVALKLEPSLNATLALQLAHGNVVVTGTNGKTTTSMFIAAAVRAAGFTPLANRSGSNMQRGIASSLALASGGDGRVEDAANRLGVFEVDEAYVPMLLPELRPHVAVFTNLFRDQLDRYGEVATVASLWRNYLALDRRPRLVLNADDPSIAMLAETREGNIYFGIEDQALDRGAPEHAADALNCLCGARLDYAASYFGHAGLWSCPSCGRKRPLPQVSASKVKLGDGHGASFTLKTPQGQWRVEMALGGLYNVHNALAAAAACVALDLPPEATISALAATSAAFGRQESFEVDGKRVELYLGKNPAGLNQVLSTLLLDSHRRVLFVILNDGVADGRDISWVWDADFEVAAGRFERVIVSGSRAADMALRLKYAGWDEATMEVEPRIAEALDVALAATFSGGTLSLVPTYTAMLEVRDMLARRTGRTAFWQ